MHIYRASSTKNKRIVKISDGLSLCLQRQSAPNYISKLEKLHNMGTDECKLNAGGRMVAIIWWTDRGKECYISDICNSKRSCPRSAIHVSLPIPHSISFFCTCPSSSYPASSTLNSVPRNKLASIIHPFPKIISKGLNMIVWRNIKK